MHMAESLACTCIHITSSHAVFTVIDVTEPPKIVQHPQSQGKIEGDEVSFSVSAEGPGTLFYQWMKDGEAITDKTFSGMDTDALHISFFSNKHKGSYKCKVINEVGSTETEPAVLSGW